MCFGFYWAILGGVISITFFCSRPSFWVIGQKICKISDFWQHSANLNLMIMIYNDNFYDMGAIFDGFEINLYV